MENQSLNIRVLGVSNATIEIVAGANTSIEDISKSTRRLAWVLVQALSVGGILDLMDQMQRAIKLEAFRTLLDEATDLNAGLVVRTTPNDPSLSYAFQDLDAPQVPDSDMDDVDFETSEYLDEDE